ncbi:riboflavin kinase [Kocuria sp. 2SI]|uniref:riboflavin kinase n=1 Tax=Kocuria sp. 2SI TaxID=2502203 RepID=UPI001485432B|nr:riboflavin kinase [Kocuria sp. 2SI]
MNSRPAARGTTIDGVIVAGVGWGRDLGYPTANLDVHDHAAIPDDGVYFGWFTLHDGSAGSGPALVGWPALLSIGSNPTFAGTARTVEAHLLDIDMDLYGRAARVELDHRMRPQRRFETVQALIAYMDDIAAEARAFLADSGWTAGDTR